MCCALGLWLILSPAANAFHTATNTQADSSVSASASQNQASGGCFPVSTVYGQLFAMYCQQGKDSFFVHSPEGWGADWEAAKRLNVGVIYTFMGARFDNAQAVMYPQVHSAPQAGSLEEAAQKQAEISAGSIGRNTGKSPLIRKGEAYVNGNGLVFAIRFFDDGPYPNGAEAAAYLVRGDTIFTLVLSAYTAEQREAALPDFKKALEGVMLPGQEKK